MGLHPSTSSNLEDGDPPPPPPPPAIANAPASTPPVGFFFLLALGRGRGAVGTAFRHSAVASAAEAVAAVAAFRPAPPQAVVIVEGQVAEVQVVRAGILGAVPLHDARRTAGQPRQAFRRRDGGGRLEARLVVIGAAERPRLAVRGGGRGGGGGGPPPEAGDVGEPKQDSKAREIGRAEETEMMGSGVEDRRTIELDVKRPADHDGATPDARNRTTTELWTISSSTNYIAASSISAVAVKSAVAQLFSAAISLAPNGTAELEILPISLRVPTRQQIDG
ncbi:hypothetical protein THAOC_10195 [Thalassiosira oceanica]|uniref:Uncharacterized protein n=1 Tax=Thalassiosira oceanica TaxID=159749 RepID=K0SUJ8_THAOC|nr:hypothetical protein THAOC_10195 [Thalassiosira oceanica]|eukprot:EJK68609.1 hypothetical protein THAOC_10195 [Thalassiosira oceanica]